MLWVSMGPAAGCSTSSCLSLFSVHISMNLQAAINFLKSGQLTVISVSAQLQPLSRGNRNRTNSFHSNIKYIIYIMKIELSTYQKLCSVNIFSHLVSTDITSDKSQLVRKALETPLNINSHKTPVKWYKINRNRVQVNRTHTTSIFFSCGCRNALELATGGHLFQPFGALLRGHIIPAF